MKIFVKIGTSFANTTTTDTEPDGVYLSSVSKKKCKPLASHAQEECF